MLKHALALGLCSITVCALSANAAPRAVEKDAVIVAAKDARDRNSLRDLDSAIAASSTHVLAVYPVWWRLQADPQKSASDYKRLIDRFRDGPIVDLARRDLAKLHARAGDWDAFRDVAAKVLGEDGELACMIWQDKLQSNEAAARSQATDEALAHWVSDKDLSAACQPVWAMLSSNAKLGRDAVLDRVRRSFAAGKASEVKRAASVLIDAGALTDAAIDRALREPGKLLARESQIQLSTRPQVELALGALARIAREDASDAKVVLDRFVHRLKPADAGYAWAAIATSGAMQHVRDANTWFKRASNDVKLNDTQEAWRVRAALRVQDWPQVKASILAMDESDRRDAAWRYWLARAHLAAGDRPAAEMLLRDLATEPGYHALLAAEELGVLPVISWDSATLTSADLTAQRNRPGISRAIALYSLGWRDEGFREWIWAIRGLKDQELLAAAEVAKQADIPDRAIATALRTTHIHDYAQRFPVHHLAAVKNASSRVGLDPAWVYAIIRQESRFMVDVRSRAGALGLMQLMPATAKFTAGRLGWNDLKTTSLSDPETNITLGSTYLRQVYEDLGDRVMAIAAYNAGPGRAKRWRDSSPLEGAIYAETIPFNETRDYVKQVTANQFYYEQRLSGKRLSMKQLLGTVPGRDKRDAASTTAAVGVAASPN